jgi:hypothetical protein
MQKIYLIIFSAFSLFCSSTEAATLHAFLVMDTEAENVGPYIEDTSQVMQEFSSEMSELSGLELDLHLYVGKKVTAGFLDDLKKMRAEPDDVILFFWNGHGFRTESKEQLWPSFSFHNDSTHAVDLYHVAEIVQEKKARLSLVIAETCNNIIPDIWAPMEVRGFDLSSRKEKIAKNAKTLFLKHQGTYLITSSSPGEFSWVGAFRESFIKNIYREVKLSSHPSWDRICQKTQAMVSSLPSNPMPQNPQYIWIPPKCF